MKIVLLEDLGVPKARIDAEKKKLEEAGHTFESYARTSDLKTLQSEIKDADALILANMPLPKEALEGAENLKYIDVAFTGTDHVPTAWCKEQKIAVSNASGYSNDAVAELVLAFAIELLRKLPALEARGKEGKAKTGIRGRLVKGKTVGIVGCGHIGKQAAALFKALGARVIGFNRSKVESEFIDEQVSLEQLLKESDIVSLHVPLTDQTKGMIGSEQLAMMKPSAFLINAARGPVVSSEALVRALNEKTIAGAALDVFDIEPPLPADDPILKADNCILTPHIGFDSEESMDLRADIVFDNLFSWLEGTIKNQVV